MINYQVNITNEALKDLNDIYNYIAYELYSIDSAQKTFEHLSQKILSLNYFPYRYPIFKKNFKSNIDLRKITINHYSIIYYIRKREVMILNILYSKQNYYK